MTVSFRSGLQADWGGRALPPGSLPPAYMDGSVLDLGRHSEKTSRTGSSATGYRSLPAGMRPVLHFGRANFDVTGLENRRLELKGKSEHTSAWVIDVAPTL